MSFLSNNELLDNLTPEALDELSKLDAQGLLLGSEETVEEFKVRLKKLQNNLATLDEDLTIHNKAVIFDDEKVDLANLLPANEFTTANQIIDKLYKINIDWVPIFFKHYNPLALCGGYSVYDEESSMTALFLSDKFKKRAKWFIYNRNELLAHELCHAARSPLAEFKLEEFFAYQTSPSCLRRYLGNCFVSRFDGLVLLMPFFVLVVAQLLQLLWFPKLWLWPCLALISLVMLYFLGRNHLERKHYYRAISALKRFKVQNASAILFRCTWCEIKQISRLRNLKEWQKFVNKQTKSKLHWRVIRHRFLALE